jgi:hypothetical protein
LKLFSRPFPYSTNNQHRLIQSLAFGTFVFVFLVLFKPFGLSDSSGNMLFIGAAFGSVTALCMLLINVLIPTIFPKRFNNEIWNIGKEITWAALNIFIIGIGNSILYTLIWPSTFNWLLVITLELFTVAVGIIPIAFFIVLKERKLFNESQKESAITNAHLQVNSALSDEIAEFPSNNKNENFSLHLSQLLFIESADNYAAVFFLDDDRKSLKQQILRVQLNQLEQHFQNFPSITRCHKSYLVNLNNVVHVSGNAQGYKLHFKDSDAAIPVSRSKSSDLLSQLKSR